MFQRKVNENFLKSFHQKQDLIGFRFWGFLHGDRGMKITKHGTKYLSDWLNAKCYCTPLLSLSPVCVNTIQLYRQCHFYKLDWLSIYSYMILRLLMNTVLQLVYRHVHVHEFAFPIHTQINKTVHIFCVCSLLINLLWCKCVPVGFFLSD